MKNKLLDEVINTNNELQDRKFNDEEKIKSIHRNGKYDTEKANLKEDIRNTRTETR